MRRNPWPASSSADAKRKTLIELAARRPTARCPEDRPTDHDESLARRRYRVFKEQTWEALQSLKEIFHYHFINAQGPVDRRPAGGEMVSDRDGNTLLDRLSTVPRCGVRAGGRKRRRRLLRGHYRARRLGGDQADASYCGGYCAGEPRLRRVRGMGDRQVRLPRPQRALDDYRPAVLGVARDIGLLFVLIFGASGVLGPWLTAHGVKVIFAVPGINLSHRSSATSPFIARELIPLMEAQGSDDEEAALALGASGWQTFWRVTIPNVNGDPLGEPQGDRVRRRAAARAPGPFLCGRGGGRPGGVRPHAGIPHRGRADGTLSRARDRGPAASPDGSPHRRGKR